MKNKTILLKDLLIQREAELILEYLEEVDLDRAKELGNKVLTKGKELGKKAIDAMPDEEQREKAKQQAIKAIKLISSKSKEIAQKVEQSSAFQKAKEEIAKELKDPKRVKAVLTSLTKILAKIFKTLSSTMTDSKKRELLNSILKTATPISIVGVVYKVIESIVEAEVEVPLIGSIGTGLDIPDIPLLDTFAMALPLIAALRITIGIYQFKSILDLGKSVAQGVGKMFKKSVNETETNLKIITSDDEEALLSLFNTPE